MRKLSRKDWAGSHPGTNVLWLLYLTELLLSTDKPVPGGCGGCVAETAACAPSTQHSLQCTDTHTHRHFHPIPAHSSRAPPPRHAAHHTTTTPPPGATAGQKRCLREFKKRLAGYSCCADVIWDELFAGLWTVTEG